VDCEAAIIAEGAAAVGAVRSGGGRAACLQGLVSDRRGMSNP